MSTNPRSDFKTLWEGGTPPDWTTPGTGWEGQGGDLYAHLREFYGRRLKTSGDFAQKACCTTDTTREHAGVIEFFPQQVREGYAGCGSPIPADYSQFSGLRILDLGCGRGADVFVLAYHAGPEGFVTGLDMTEEQLAIARDAIPVVMQRFGFESPNVVFHQGYIETADAIPSGSVDLVVSNCVINLSPFKEQVFKTIHRVLREGGAWYIADVIADRRPSSALRSDPDLVAECLGGASYDKDLRGVIGRAGFPYTWEVKRTPIPAPDVERRFGESVKFFSVVWRSIKLTRPERVDGEDLPPLESTCEDYGQVARYLGNLPTSLAKFVLDKNHVFESGRPVPVCRNTANILRFGRLARYFEVSVPVRHFGAFACGPTPATQESVVHGPGSGPSRCC